MVGWDHRLRGHEFEQTLGDGEGQGSPEHCSPWGQKESDTTERLDNRLRGCVSWVLMEGKGKLRFHVSRVFWPLVYICSLYHYSYFEEVIFILIF